VADSEERIVARKFGQRHHFLVIHVQQIQVQFLQQVFGAEGSKVEFDLIEFFVKVELFFSVDDHKVSGIGVLPDDMKRYDV
jgi:hypothetical protein